MALIYHWIHSACVCRTQLFVHCTAIHCKQIPGRFYKTMQWTQTHVLILTCLTVIRPDVQSIKRHIAEGNGFLSLPSLGLKAHSNWNYFSAIQTYTLENYCTEAARNNILTTARNVRIQGHVLCFGHVFFQLYAFLHFTSNQNYLILPWFRVLDSCTCECFLCELIFNKPYRFQLLYFFIWRPC